MSTGTECRQGEGVDRSRVSTGLTTRLGPGFGPHYRGCRKGQGVDREECRQEESIIADPCDLPFARDLRNNREEELLSKSHVM